MNKKTLLTEMTENELDNLILTAFNELVDNKQPQGEEGSGTNGGNVDDAEQGGYKQETDGQESSLQPGENEYNSETDNGVNKGLEVKFESYIVKILSSAWKLKNSGMQVNEISNSLSRDIFSYASSINIDVEANTEYVNQMINEFVEKFINANKKTRNALVKNYANGIYNALAKGQNSTDDFNSFKDVNSILKWYILDRKRNLNGTNITLDNIVDRILALKGVTINESKKDMSPYAVLRREIKNALNTGKINNEIQLETIESTIDSFIEKYNSSGTSDEAQDDWEEPNAPDDPYLDNNPQSGNTEEQGDPEEYPEEEQGEDVNDGSNGDIFFNGYVDKFGIYQSRLTTSDAAYNTEFKPILMSYKEMGMFSTHKNDFEMQIKERAKGLLEFFNTHGIDSDTDFISLNVDGIDQTLSIPVSLNGVNQFINNIRIRNQKDAIYYASVLNAACEYGYNQLGKMMFPMSAWTNFGPIIINDGETYARIRQDAELDENALDDTNFIKGEIQEVFEPCLPDGRQTYSDEDKIMHTKADCNFILTSLGATNESVNKKNTITEGLFDGNNSNNNGFQSLRDVFGKIGGNNANNNTEMGEEELNNLRNILKTPNDIESSAQKIYGILYNAEFNENARYSSQYNSILLSLANFYGEVSAQNSLKQAQTQNDGGESEELFNSNINEIIEEEVKELQNLQTNNSGNNNGVCIIDRKNKQITFLNKERLEKIQNSENYSEDFYKNCVFEYGDDKVINEGNVNYANAIKQKVDAGESYDKIINDAKEQDLSKRNGEYQEEPQEQQPSPFEQNDNPQAEDGTEAAGNEEQEEQQPEEGEETIDDSTSEAEDEGMEGEDGGNENADIQRILSANLQKLDTTNVSFPAKFNLGKNQSVLNTNNDYEKIYAIFENSKKQYISNGSETDAGEMLNNLNYLKTFLPQNNVSDLASPKNIDPNYSIMLETSQEAEKYIAGISGPSQATSESYIRNIILGLLEEAQLTNNINIKAVLGTLILTSFNIINSFNKSISGQNDNSNNGNNSYLGAIINTAKYILEFFNQGEDGEIRNLNNNKHQADCYTVDWENPEYEQVPEEYYNKQNQEEEGQQEQQ